MVFYEYTFEKQMGYINGPINCIKQSKTTGNILVCCYNGNIYLLTPPNIDYYLKEDKGSIKFFKCSEKCLNCSNNPDYCISCKKR